MANVSSSMVCPVKSCLVMVVMVMSIITGCQNKADDNNHEHGHEHGEHTQNSPNQALYEDVMRVHDEVMPKMDDLYKAKVSLQNRLKSNPDLAEDKKLEINNTIARLDSASEGMMVWMREFNPIPDSLGEERARSYLENEKARVGKVKESILQALKEAESKK